MFAARAPFFANPGTVAPIYNSVGTMSRGSITSSGSPGTLTWTHTVPTAANRMALAFVYLRVFTGTTVTTTVPTLGGTAMTLITSVTTADGQFWVYRLANPATGAQTASWSATRISGTSTMAWMANTIIYTGVSSVADFGSATGTASSFASVTSAAIPSGHRAVGSLAGGSLSSQNLMTATGGTAGALRFSNGQNIVRIGIADAAGAGGPVTFAISTGQANPWGGLWVSLAGM